MLYEVIVKPNSKKGPLITEDGNHLTVFLREKPVDGGANRALIKLLSSHFKLPQAQIKIKTGFRSKHKLIEIDK